MFLFTKLHSLEEKKISLANDVKTNFNIIKTRHHKIYNKLLKFNINSMSSMIQN